MKNSVKKIMAGIMAVITMAGATIFQSDYSTNDVIFNNSAIVSHAASTKYVSNFRTSKIYERKFNQFSSYYKKNDKQLYDAGCGLFALGNAIYSMTGQTVDMSQLKKWAKDNKAWTPNDGLYRYIYFDKLNKSPFAKQYGFKTTGPYSGGITSNNRIIASELSKNNVAVLVGIKNHFICILDYDKKTNKYYVIESAEWDGRGLKAAGWVSESKLKSGNTNIRSYAFVTFDTSIAKVLEESNNSIDTLLKSIK